jgi:hypothetical protein
MRESSIIKNKIDANVNVVIDENSLKYAIKIKLNAKILRELDKKNKVFDEILEVALKKVNNLTRTNNHDAKETRVLVKSLV